MDLNQESKEGLILDNIKMPETITDYLISPTMHLFPLSGQLGSRGVSSMITLNLWIFKVYNVNSKYTMLQYKTKQEKREKVQKSQNEESPLGGGEMDQKSLLKLNFFCSLTML